MANRIRIRRTGTASQVPITTDLLTGELAINYAEGKLFALKDDGTQSVVTIGEDLASESFANRIRNIVGITDTFEPIGFSKRTDSTISFNNTTRTFTIAPAVTSYTVWCKGKKYIFNSSQSIQLGATTGLYYIYYDNTGILSYRTSYFDWENDAPVAYVYWNSTISTAVYFADERHGVTLDWATHEYLHRTRGAAFANGFSISNYVINGSGAEDSHAQIDLSGGTFFDEDLQVDIIHSNTPTPNTWEQDLAGPARIPVLYLDNTSWQITTPTNFPLKQGTTFPQYNLLTGSAWSAVDAEPGKYLNSWILATNNINYPVISILGQQQYNNIGQAQAVDFSSLILTDFPSFEFRPLYKIIYYTGSFANTANAVIRFVTDIRGLQSVNVSASVASDHGLLSGLGDDDHAQYVNTGEPRSITATHSFTGQQNFTNSTESVSTSTGAIVVTGGVGVGGNISIGGNIYDAIIDCGTY